MANPAVYDALAAQAVVTVATGTAASIGANVAGTRGVRLQSDPANTANIYLGSDATLTAAPVKAWGVLRPGEWIFLPINGIAEIFAISATASQKLLVGSSS